MTVFWLCPKPDAPSGGVMYIHRFAHLLDEAGIRSRVIQQRPFEVVWDAHPVPAHIVSAGLESLSEEDTVVIPEVMWPVHVSAKVMNTNCRKVVFLQNRIWIGADAKFDGVDVMVCSRYLYNHVERVYGVKPIGIVSPYLDDDVWSVGVKHPGQVLIMARRNHYHQRVRDALREAGFIVSYVTSNLTQREIAGILDECEYYVHLASPEGWPAAVAEAMRSGTIVVGTTGGGGNEFMFHGQTAMVVPDPELSHGTTEEFIDGIVAAMKLLQGDPDMRSRIKVIAHEWSLRFTADNTTRQLVDVFK